MRLNRALIAAAAVGALSVSAMGLSGCAGAARALGADKVQPDEFRVVTKAPLQLPPDYALRPPAPGEPRPQELQPESAARTALLGARDSANRSEGEKLLVSRAGADRADPLIRFVLDDEFGDIAHKDKSFADFVMFWRSGNAATPNAPQTDPGATTPAPVDAAAEEERLRALTGTQPVVISRRGNSRIKLPGL